MSGLSYLVAILRRDLCEDYIEFFKSHGARAVFSTLCGGTAQKKTLDLLGLEPTERVMLSCVAPDDAAQRIMRALVTEARIDAPGGGIAFTVSVESVGGSRCLDYLAGGSDCLNNENEVNKMHGGSNRSLIIAIAESGCVSDVMSAARAAGASGGTSIHAKGTSTKEDAKFFGVSIAAEKEIVYIVAKNDDADRIVKAIMENAGAHTAARAAVFTLRVDSVAGILDADD